MVKEAKKSGIPFHFVLFDTWFSNPARLVELKGMEVDGEGTAIPAKLVYARNYSSRKNWVCFVCTDTSLNEKEILEAYMLRWQIETYFKLTKSYLKLRTECHSTSYDAITSHMVIVSIRYMILKN